MAIHVFDTMGTVASLRVTGALPPRSTLDRIEAEFAERESRFSLYRPDSEISRIGRGELRLPSSSHEMRACYSRALRWRSRTHDAFTPHRPDGVIDLSGIVKAEAMADAGDVLDEAGHVDWLLNVGGDVLARGRIGGEPWRIGIIDPGDRASFLCTVDVGGTGRALATSGTAERGEHVWRSDRLSAYTQVSVVAADIVTADVLATAILSGGEETRDQMLDLFGDAIDVLTVEATGSLTATPGMAARGMFASA